jgi:putative sterol carrier protein
MEINTPAEFFEKVLPHRFNPSKAEGFESTVQINVTGPNGGQWVVTIKQSKLDIRGGECSNPSMTVTVADSNFLDLVNGKVSGERAFMSGKLKFEGSLPVALRIMQIGLL